MHGFLARKNGFYTCLQGDNRSCAAVANMFSSTVGWDDMF